MNYIEFYIHVIFFCFCFIKVKKGNFDPKEGVFPQYGGIHYNPGRGYDNLMDGMISL